MMNDIVVTCDFCNTELQPNKKYDPQHGKLRVDFTDILISLAAFDPSGKEKERFDSCAGCYSNFIDGMDRKAKSFGRPTSEDRKQEIEEVKDKERQEVEARMALAQKYEEKGKTKAKK